MTRARLILAMLSAAVVLWAADAVQACAVCGGDPQSELTRGALSGVIVMVGVTYGLLMGFVALGATWVIRARRLAASNPDSKAADGE